MQQRHRELDHTAAAATALEGARAGFWQAQGALSALVISGDATFVDDYDGALVAADQNLANARAQFLAMGKTAEVSAVDDLAKRIGQFDETVRWLFPTIIEADRQMLIELANASMSDLTATNTAIIAGLERMVQEAQEEASAELEAADLAADLTLWLLLGLSGVALATGVGTVVTLVGSVVGPLAALRASARAITSGRPQARAKVSGPEEVASLARDFNEMTDALAAKTEALRESETRYRLLAENATDIIWTMDMNLRLTYESPSVARIRGYTPEEAMAQTMEETLTPASLELASKVLVEELAPEAMPTKAHSRSRTLELEHTCKDGSTVWLEVTTTFLRDEDGRAVGILGASRDISERKRAEEELQHLATLPGENPNPVIRAARNGTVLYANQGSRPLLELWGCAEGGSLPPEPYQQVESALTAGKTITSEVLCGDRTFLVMCAPIAGRDYVNIYGVDISERKRMEEQLRESEEKYRELVENINEIIYSVDSNGLFTYISPVVEQLGGYIPSEVIGRPFTEFVHPDDILPLMHSFRETVAGNLEPFEYRVLTKSGEAHWVRTSSRPVFDGDRLVGFRAVLADITERKRAEEAVLRAKEEWERTFDAVPDLITVIDDQYHIVRANRAMAERLGMTPDECVGKVCYEVVHGLDCPPGFCPHTPCLADGRDHAAEVKEPRLGGEFLVSVTPLADQQGRRIGSVHVARDITDRKRAEEELRESESKYRTLVENIPQKVFFKDRNCIYVSCNGDYARDLSLNHDEIAGKTDYDFYPRELADKYRADDKRVMQSGETEDIEEEYVHDGRQSFIHTIKTPVKDEEGSVVGVLGVFWDVTERKQAEEERTRLQAELEVRVITDGLTGLYNHAHFYQRLAEETERSGRYNGGFAVAMMDVDNFKRFNDSRGHQEGDKMLRLVADSIRSGLRGSDLAFRYGGDEFAAILLHADAARARAVMERIKKRLAKGLAQMNDGAASCLSLSAGIACFRDDGSTPDALVRIADTALYAAKWAAQTRQVCGESYAVQSLMPPPAMAASGMLSTTAGSLAAALRELGVPDVMAELNLRTVAALGTLAEIKDPYVRGHQERTSDWAATLAQEMGLSQDRVRGTRLAGLVHDLGKAGVSKRILRKPGKLTEEEFAEIKEHPPLGSMMIISEVEALQQLVPIVRHHHERFDGKGYPDGLAGEDIPLEARILAVVDAFDAMTHERSYRKALGREHALAEIERGAGTQFDPAVVEVFLAWAAKESEDPPARRQDDNELAAAPTMNA